MWPWVIFDGMVIFLLVAVAAYHFNNAIMAFGAVIAEQKEREKTCR